jgi:hypothetical protein
MITLLAPLLLVGLHLGLIVTLAPRHGGLALWTKATAIAATARVAVLWEPPCAQWRQALGLWATPCSCCCFLKACSSPGTSSGPSIELFS